MCVCVGGGGGGGGGGGRGEREGEGGGEGGEGEGGGKGRKGEGKGRKQAGSSEVSILQPTINVGIKTHTTHTIRTGSPLYSSTRAGSTQNPDSCSTCAVN